MPSLRAEPPSLPSTKWGWRLVKLTEGGAPERAQRGAAARRRLLPTTNRRVNTIIEVAYKGGPESQWNVKCRGIHYVFPGYLTLEDVMAVIHHEVT